MWACKDASPKSAQSWGDSDHLASMVEPRTRAKASRNDPTKIDKHQWQHGDMKWGRNSNSNQMVSKSKEGRVYSRMNQDCEDHIVHFSSPHQVSFIVNIAETHCSHQVSKRITALLTCCPSKAVLEMERRLVLERPPAGISDETESEPSERLVGILHLFRQAIRHHPSCGRPLEETSSSLSQAFFNRMLTLFFA